MSSSAQIVAVGCVNAIERLQKEEAGMSADDYGYRDEARALEWCRDHGMTITPQFVYPFCATGYLVSDGRKQGAGATLAEAVQAVSENQA